MRLILIIAIFSFPFSGFTQNWDSLCDTRNQNARSLYVDSVDNVVYIGGAFRYILVDNDTIDTRGIVKWDGENFETLGYFPNFACNNWNCNPVLSVIRYKDEIYSSLLNPAPDEGEIQGIARWNGVQWDSVGGGVDGFIFDQVVYDNDLYVVGRFDSINGNYEANSIAKWDGEQWHQIGFPYVPSGGIFSITILGATVYNGDLYVCGNFFNEEETVRDVARFDGENWYPVGEPIQGGWDDVFDIVLFQDELYICGDFKVSSGNAGNKIMKLVNGSWVDVGGSFDDEFDIVEKMIVYQNKLYIIGGFRSVGGGVSARNIAIWDGDKWCGIGVEFDPSRLVDIVEFNSDLIIAGNFDTIDNLAISELARWTGEGYLDTCGAVVSTVFEPEISLSDLVTIYPNPSRGDLKIEFNNQKESNFSFDLRIYNLLGEVVYQDDMILQKKEIEISFLPSGIYWINLINKRNKNSVTESFVIQK